MVIGRAVRLSAVWFVAAVVIGYDLIGHHRGPMLLLDIPLTVALTLAIMFVTSGRRAR